MYIAQCIQRSPGQLGGNIVFRVGKPRNCFRNRNTGQERKMFLNSARDTFSVPGSQFCFRNDATTQGSTLAVVN